MLHGNKSCKIHMFSTNHNTPSGQETIIITVSLLKFDLAGNNKIKSLGM